MSPGCKNGRAEAAGAARPGATCPDALNPMQAEPVSYDPKWPSRFRAEAARIGLHVTGLTLWHIGSTAVPGLMAKPIIDMLGEVADLAQADAFAPALTALGYEAKGAHGLTGRRYFRRDIDGTRCFHLHVYEAGSAAALRHLAVRDYLRAHPREALAYAAEKRRAAGAADPGIPYASAKAAYMAGLEATALDWAARPRVIASLEDETGSKCVDIRTEGGQYSWVECRRDPEDSFGWRFTGAGASGFTDANAAQEAALRACPWATEPGPARLKSGADPR
ncbi:MAG: GrpB family protein [Pseudomonadota bacterium]